MRQPLPTKERICAGCKKPFLSHKRGSGWVDYCSPKCYRDHRLYNKVNPK